MRTRLLNPALFFNEILGTRDPLLTILYAGLWCAADKEGRLEDRPLKLKAKIFPYRNLDIEKLINELAGLRFLIRYKVLSSSYIFIPKFKCYQHPHQTEKESTIPPPPDEILQEFDSQHIENIETKIFNGELTVKQPLSNGYLTSGDANSTIQYTASVSDLCSKKGGVGGNKNDEIPYDEIVDYLNSKAGTNHRAKTSSTKELIHARWSEGYRLNDFKKVIDNKIACWLHEPEHNIYLRPSTLFARKHFDEYLNENHSVQPVSRSTLQIAENLAKARASPLAQSAMEYFNPEEISKTKGELNAGSNTNENTASQGVHAALRLVGKEPVDTV